MSGARAALRKLVRDPLAHFLAAGALLFAIFSTVSGAREDIHISAGLADRLYEEHLLLVGPAAAATRTRLVEAYIEEEILFREALKRGAHRSDASLRARLVDLMRFTLTSEPAAPDEATLRAFYDAHAEDYRTDSKITFDQAFFREDPADPEAALAALRAGRRPDGSAPFWLGDRLEAYDRSVIRQTLGVEFAQSLFAAPIGEWSGPIASSRGVHLVRVESVTPPQALAFEAIRDQAEADFIAAKRNAELEAAVTKLRRKYRIVFEKEQN